MSATPEALNLDLPNNPEDSGVVSIPESQSRWSNIEATSNQRLENAKNRFSGFFSVAKRVVAVALAPDEAFKEGASVVAEGASALSERAVAKIQESGIMLNERLISPAFEAVSNFGSRVVNSSKRLAGCGYYIRSFCCTIG